MSSDPVSPETLHVAQYSPHRQCYRCNREASRAELESGACLRCAARRRMLELARQLRGPENSAPLTELVDLIELWEGSFS